MNAERPSVSVVIPAYNSADTVGGTLASLFTQTHPADEIIVVDDGSSDDTAKIVQAYGERVVLVRQVNRGASAARNTGISRATGQLVAFVDSDDVLLPSYLHAMVNTWIASGGGNHAVVSDAYFLRDEGMSFLRRINSSHFPPAKAQRLAILQGNFANMFLLWPRDGLQALGGFSENLRVVEDWDLVLRGIFSGTELVFQRRALALYRWRPGSLSSRQDAMESDEERLLQRARDLFGAEMTRQERDFLDHRLACGSPRVMRRRGDEALAAGDAAEARRHYAQAARLVPRDLKLRARSATLVIPGASRIWRRRLQAATRTL